MDLYTMEGLREDPAPLWDSISKGNDLVITDHGRPAVMVLDISGYDLEEAVHAVERLRGILAFDKMRKAAASKGPLTEEEIEAEIRAARTGE